MQVLLRLFFFRFSLFWPFWAPVAGRSEAVVWPPEAPTAEATVRGGRLSKPQSPWRRL